MPKNPIKMYASDENVFVVPLSKVIHVRLNKIRTLLYVETTFVNLGALVGICSETEKVTCENGRY